MESAGVKNQENEEKNKILGSGKHSIVYEVDSDVCLKMTSDYEYDAFYKLAVLPQEIREKYSIVPILKVDFDGEQATCLMKRLFPLEVSKKDKEALLDFSDYHEAYFEDAKLEEICKKAVELLSVVEGCELDLHYENIMRDSNNRYYLTDPFTFNN